MQILEYLVIASGLFFSLTFLWLLNVIGVLDCLKSGAGIKSVSNCLTFDISQSEKILAESKDRRRQLTNQNTQSQAASGSASNQLLPYTL